MMVEKPIGSKKETNRLYIIIFELALQLGQ